jgi:hypothetical protein
MSPTDYYKKRNDEAVKQLQILNQKISINAFFRLLSFAGIFGFLFGLIQYKSMLAISLAIGSLIVFLSLVRHQIQLQKKRKYFLALNKIVENELDACNHIFTAFRDGNEYKNHRHAFSNDLDLFGKSSLFQMINRCVTRGGEGILAHRLTNETCLAEKILELQHSISEISQKPDLLIHFRTTGSVSDIVEEDMSAIKEWLVSYSYMAKNKVLHFIRFVLPGLTLLSLVWLIISGTNSILFINLLVLNIIIIGFKIKQTNKEHNKVNALLAVFNKYKDLLTVFEDIEFNSSLLKEIADDLKNGVDSAALALNKLSKKVNALDSRLNLVAAIFLEGLFMWDFHCLASIEKWRVRYGDRLVPWLDKVAYFDAFVSMATFTYNNPQFIFPIPNKEVVLEAKSIGHPLIPEPARILNNFIIHKKGEFSIITGANMAGKSTFLRTVGINLILAMAGMPVCSESFVFTPRKLFTSMRTADSLSDNESYFYAELKRLKELIDKLKDGDDLFIILDEILKGTNSIDKQKGSQLALEKILQLGGTGIIATHDLALTDLEKLHPKLIKNQCFEIEIDKAKIYFDYKLYDGVTKNMNAMLLMEQMGII